VLGQGENDGMFSFYSFSPDGWQLDDEAGLVC
jgi:hypothetical protein